MSDELKDSDRLILNEYNNPANGFRAKRIYEVVKQTYPLVTMKHVKDILSKVQTEQMFKPAIVKPKHLFPLQGHYPLTRLQIDLMDMSNEVVPANRGYKWLFCCVDLTSKYAWAVPMKSKEGPESLAIFEMIVDQILRWKKMPPVQVDSDFEPAFRSDAFREYCDSLQIYQNFVSHINGKGAVESFNKTLRVAINKLKKQLHTNNWVDHIAQILGGYNNTVHSATDSTPNEAVKLAIRTPYYDKKIKKQVSRAKATRVGKLNDSIRVGSRVRVKIRRTQFAKGTLNQWSKEILTVKSIVDPTQIYVSDRVGYYSLHELLPVTSATVYEPEVSEESKQQARQERKQYQQTRTTARRVAKEGVVPNYEEKTNEEKSERAIRRRQPDRGPMLNIDDYDLD